MPTIPLYFHYMVTLGDRFDRPDVPAASAPDFTPQIVFKLFVEIPAGASGGPTPFSTLAGAVHDWAVGQFKISGQSADLLASAIPALVTFDKLTDFLADAANGFEFALLPGAKVPSQSTVLAPFPMLPFLRLTPPEPAATVDFSTRKPCSADYLNALMDPFAVPRQSDAASAAPAATRAFPSLAAGMFTDYFVTLIRHLLDQSDVAAAAKAAGLFLMHSIRLPDPDAPLGADYPLYVLSGQQLPLPPDTSKEPGKQYDQYSGYAVQLAANTGTKVPLSFPESGGKFSFDTLPAQIAKLLDPSAGSLAAQFDPGKRIVSLAQSEPFAVVPRRFALSDGTVWNPGNHIYALPQSLRDQLTSSPLPSGLDLSLLMRGTPQQNDTDPSIPPDPVPATGDYFWATRVNFTIRQVADPNASGKTLPTIFAIAGMDTDSRDDLLSFLLAGATADSYQVSLLYSANPAALNQGLQSDPIAGGEVAIVKSNFSTQAHTVADATESTADIVGSKADFLKLLWEASLVSSGGFSLYYAHGTGLSAALFGQSGTAVVTVMIVPHTRVAVRRFHNCAVCASADAAFIDPPVHTVAAGETLATIKDLLNTTVEALASANATNIQVPATGALLPASDGTTAYTVQAYDNLLSLALRYESQPLGSQTLHALWAALLAALPDGILSAGASLQLPGWVVGRPTISPGAFGFRAVAVPPANRLQKLYSFLGTEIHGLSASVQTGSMPASPQTTSPGATGVNPFYRQILYLADANPYSRIRQTATLALSYQDVFGNRCLPSSQARELQFHLRYRDPLIGLSQWPGTTVSFDFDSGPQIIFTLAFEATRYVPAAGVSLDTAQQRAANNLQTYRSIALQIGQPGVSLQVKSSLSAPAASTSLLNVCGAHVEKVCDFLQDVLKLQKKTAPVTHSDLASLARDNSVPVADLAAVNQNLANLLLTGTGRQLMIPVQYAVNQNETLSGIAQRQNTLVTNLAAGNADVPGLFGSPITMGGAVFVPKPADTPSSIALAHQVTVEQIFAENQDGPVLRAGTVITVGAAKYNLKAGDTFGSIARDQRVSVPLLATANQDGAILNTAPGITIEIPIAPSGLTPDEAAAAIFGPTVQDFKPVAIGFPLSPAITSTVTPISVSLAITRPDGLVDPLFSDTAEFAGIRSVETEIRPDASIGQNVDALKPFATRFENAFTAFHLKLALGPDHAGTALATSAKRLYAIRLQDAKPLFQIEGQARFYAPPPLLNTGWSGTITPTGRPASAAVTFTNADLDAWAREFVTTLDLLLSPPYAAALLASDHASTYQMLASAKASIGAAMSASVVPIFGSATPGSDLASAQDALYQRVLVQLQEFYKIDAIVQFSAITAYTGDAEKANVPARLSGSLSGSIVPSTGSSASQSQPDFTLSDATIDLSQAASELTFLLHLASSSQLADLSLSLSFSPGAVELESAFQGAQLAPGYEAFDRVVLLPSSNDSASAPFATVDIPVPLRAYPAPPSLITQSVLQNLPAPPARPSLADLKAFQYQFRFNYAIAPQDQLQIGLATLPSAAVTTPATGGAAPASGVDNLPAALAQWAVFASGEGTDLSGLLAATPTPQSITAVADFASLAGAIAGAWSPRTPQLAQLPSPLPPEIFTVTQDKSGQPDDHVVTVTSIAPPDPLDVIRVQSIRGSLHVTRNGTLRGGTGVNNAFVYQVPTVQFTAPVVPLFREDAPIDVTALPVPPFLNPLFAPKLDPLRGQIATLIHGLLDAGPATPMDSLPNIRIAVSFEFPLAIAVGANAAMPTLVTRTPVTLLPRFAFDPSTGFLGDNGVCANVANELLSWHTREASSAGVWVFDVSIYSNVSGDSVQPLLELTNLRAPAHS